MTGGSQPRVVVLGYIVRGPLGGLSWHHLQYLLGFQAIGCDVTFFEDSDDYPACYTPSPPHMSTDPTYGLGFLKRALDRLGLRDRYAYYDAHTDTWFGRSREDALATLASADVLIDVSGVNRWRPWLAHVPMRVLIDTDPAFTQIKHLRNPDRGSLRDRYQAFLTFGESIEPGFSTVPDDGLPWRSTRQPVHLPSWTDAPTSPSRSYTTVMQWESYPAVEYQGRRFGSKREGFDEFVGLPGRVPVRLQLALGGVGTGADPRVELRSRGWSIVDPLRVARTPWSFQRYLRLSRGEWTVAKQAYVQTNSGWFSERSANYLASGRPVVTQETGFSRFIPTGEGLFAFSSIDEAAAAIEAIESDYERNRKAAREIAGEYFDARTVLARLIDDVFSTG